MKVADHVGKTEKTHIISAFLVDFVAFLLADKILHSIGEIYYI